MEAGLALTRRHLAALETFDPELLDASTRLSLRLFRHSAELAIEGYSSAGTTTCSTRCAAGSRASRRS